MSRSVKARLTAVLALGGLLVVVPTVADDQPDRDSVREPREGGIVGAPQEPDQFGLENQYTTFGIGSFMAQSSSMGHGYKTNGYIYPTAVSGQEWIAEIGPATGIPVGAMVIQVCAYVFDGSASKEASLSVGAYEFGTASDLPGFTDLGRASTGVASTPFYTAICVSPTDLVVRSYTDFAGDSTQFYGYDRVGIGLEGDNSEVAFGGVLVRWQRQLTPAPMSATFDDVPTGHPFFQHVEALYDSGITAGCGGGNYCPDAPVTRGQMAVFLAKGLGLAWPF